ncbi:MAG: hypothetical protein ABSB56_00010 [Nitrososphaerales archaeon]|jgi:hypothetical protein
MDEGNGQSERLDSLKDDLQRDPKRFFGWVLELRDEVPKLRDKLETAERILSYVLDCGTLDLECIYDMETNHPGTVERAIELKEELGSINFGNFVMAAKDKALSEVEDEIAEGDTESFRDMIVDDNYVAWGGVAAYGSYEGEDRERNQSRQELFADFVSGSLDKDRFLEEYQKLLPESDVKSDQAAMVSGRDAET